MTVDRRKLLGAGITAGLGLGAVMTGAGSEATAAGTRLHKRADPRPAAHATSAEEFGLRPDSGSDQSKAMQAAIDSASAQNAVLQLPAGRFRVEGITLRSGTRMEGAAGATVLEFAGSGSFMTAKTARDVRLSGLVLDGRNITVLAGGLLDLDGCVNLTLHDLTVRNSRAHGIALRNVSGRIADCDISQIGQAGLFSLDADGLAITHNTVTDCANNGIQVWRSAPGEDGTIVSGNRISRIDTKAGGTGQNGNGINVYRAGSVMVSANRITDSAYSAIRGNSASNIQMTGNSCARIGEVALYAEFGFEGALIANNLIDNAATGIAVTNFNEGGRLAVIQGNLIRNLKRREHEPVDKRGNGIGVEADSIVSGNVIENAPSTGIFIGWGHYMRNVMATSNLIRNAGIGISITADPAAGTCLIAQNMIDGTARGAIRAMNQHEPVGPDLARAGGTALANIHVDGNVAV